VAAAYDELNNLFQNQLNGSAFFVPVAFHVHSPGSHDWGRHPGDKAANDPSKFTDAPGTNAFLDELAKHFRIVCITDHLKSGYACQLAQAAKARDDITVFPGVEASVVGGQLGSSRIHLLAIFPPDTKASQIDRIYSAHAGDGPFPADEDRTGKEEFKLEGSLAEWRDLIRGQAGIFVAAHIDEHPRGLRAKFRATREGSLGFERTGKGSDAPQDVVKQVSEEFLGYIAELAPDALEIMNPKDRQHYAEFTTHDGKTHRIPCVTRSDHHCLEDFARDDLTTWVKVARADFSSVVDALGFFETRIRFKHDLPKTPSPRLVGVRLRSPSKEGLFEDAVVAFNPNLNCLIGPRGSGKSTVIEALRYVLGLNSALDVIRAEQGLQLNYGEIAKRIQDANLKDTLIEVIYEVEGETRYCLSATFDPLSAVVPTVHTLDGAERPMTIEAIASEFPVRLYSWSEIETLGREISLQRGLLDRLVPGLLQLVERRSRIVEELATNRGLIDGQAKELGRLLQADRGLLRRYSQFKTDFELINTPQAAQLFSDLDEARDRLVVLEETLANLRRVREALEEVATPEALLLQPALDERSEETKAWWNEHVAAELDLAAASDAVGKAIAEALKALDNQQRIVTSLIEAQTDAVAQTTSELRVQTQSDPADEVMRDQREERKVRFDAATARRDDYLAAYTAFEESLADREKLVEELEAAETEIAVRREASRDDLLAKLNAAQTGLAIDIDLKVGGDRSAAIAYMRDEGFLTREAAGHFRDRKIAERLCRMAKPTTTARALLASDASLLEADGAALGVGGALTKDEAKRLIDHFLSFSLDAAADVKVVERDRLLQILELQEKPIDDEMRILLGPKPVDELSPGQRSSAMLPLVALSETAPLVIDQPEDNLDQRMVGKTLTKILADLKETRQIIVTTHNANIVVGGDAEQVIVLEPVGAHAARVERTGSIDDHQIIDDVLAIIEGGREAFQTRRRRYHIEN
jgi:ABC-type cobalamin/Fe3+-siderophores transport system ATPase subunit